MLSNVFKKWSCNCFFFPTDPQRRVRRDPAALREVGCRCNDILYCWRNMFKHFIMESVHLIVAMERRLNKNVNSCGRSRDHLFFPLFVSFFSDCVHVWKVFVRLFVSSCVSLPQHSPFATLLTPRICNTGWSREVGVIISSASPQIAPLFCSGH